MVRAPGVYYEPSEQRVPPLALGKTGVPVLLGMARRGPLGAPVRVTSRARFRELFGDPVPEGFLDAAVQGFFDNGGEACLVLRVARIAGAEGEDLARRARLGLLDGAGARCLMVQALDEGVWGNALRLDVQGTPDAARTFLTRDASAGDRVLQVKSVHGLTPGTLVRVHDEQNTQSVVLQKVDGKALTLAEPLGHDFASAAPSYVAAATFDLRVADLERQERFERLSLWRQSPRFVERVVNQQSRLVRVRATRPGTDLARSLPVALEAAPLQGGGDGLADLGPDDFIGHDHGPSDRRGLWSLVERPEIDLIVLPDLMAAYSHSKRFRSLRDVEAVQDAAVTLCERSSNRFVILDPPPGGDFEEALRWRRQFDSAYCAFYFPWLVCLDGARKRVVPPSGHLAGVFARSDQAFGVHKAPANEIVRGIVDLEVLLQDTHLAMLNDAGVNCVRPFAQRGLRVWGARSASGEPEWRFLNVRRTVSAISAAIDRGMQWAIFEPNQPVLWKRLSRMIVAFLSGLREQGMLVGETPEQAFYVKCDAETNPPDVVDRGMLVTEIGLAVTRPVEFIVFRISQRLEDQAQQVEE